jgi:CHASE3 domain sensor protein
MVAAVIGCLLMVVLAVGALFQATEHHNKLADAQTHDNTAAMFQSAENEGKAASASLQQYVATGDVAFIAEAQAHTQSGVQQLTSAVGIVGSDPNGFVDKGSQMVQASGQVIALRQTGDTAGAIQLMQDLEPSFNSFIAAQDRVIAEQRQAAVDNRSSAESAKAATFWLALLSGVFGAMLVVGGLVVVTRGSRRVTGTASA